MKITFWLTMLFLTSGALVDLCAKTPGGKPSRKLKVVIDASHDGGAWWFPQGPPPFDSEKWHQGSELAAYFKGRGWEVVEIPRGTRMTDQLRGASILVRLNLFGTYTDSEVEAYREFVRKGGSLLLVQAFVRDDEKEHDSVARAFGVRFEGKAEADLMQSADAYSSDFNNTVYQIGSIVALYPKSTRPLAYLEGSDRLVMGMFRFGRGRVVFLSSVYSILHVRQQFTGRLFDELARAHSRRKRR